MFSGFLLLLAVPPQCLAVAAALPPQGFFRPEFLNRLDEIIAPPRQDRSARSPWGFVVGRGEGKWGLRNLTWANACADKLSVYTLILYSIYICHTRSDTGVVFSPIQ